MDKYYFSSNQLLRKGKPPTVERQNPYETLAVALIALWFVALGIGVTLDGWIHLLLIAAVGVGLRQFAQSRKSPQ